MGTTNPDLANDPYHCNLGYSWTPNRQERKMLYKLKAKEGNEDDDDFCCDPDKPFDEYYPDGCSWLKHRVMEITDGLGPVLKHYHAPTVQDAIQKSACKAAQVIIFIERRPWPLHAEGSWSFPVRFDNPSKTRRIALSWQVRP